MFDVFYEVGVVFVFNGGIFFDFIGFWYCIVLKMSEKYRVVDIV